MAPFINKGFKRKRDSGHSARIPTGQYEVTDFPVLSAGPPPRIAPGSWTFTLEGLIVSPRQWTWEQFIALPQQSFTRDIHCVTKWSKLDTHWEGVSIDTLLVHVTLLPEVHYVMAYCYGGYTSNIPIADLQQCKAFVGLQYEGLSLPPEHGGPARLVVPHLYFWKSAKWIQGLRFMEKDEPGFWERGGYSMYGDPWQEQRYRSDDD